MRLSLKGRGAQINPDNKFLAEERGVSPLLFEDEYTNPSLKTKYLYVNAKTILNKVESPDVPGAWSMNPYQGCEHGCVYCYARNTHTYWGYSAGVDFETKIMIKQNAPELLEKKLASSTWKAKPIMLSGNTDCYQPIEKKTGITRKLLQVFWKYRHPVSIVTKNNLILRDVDILKNLAAHHLITVAVSICTLDEDLRQKLEPRTSTIAKRLHLVRTLSDMGIPVVVLAAPIIPGLNDHDILPLVKKVAAAGAKSIKQIVVRLNGDVAEIFTDWMEGHYPNRAKKVLNKIKSMHGGKLHNSNFHSRMQGDGLIAEIIHQQFDLAKRLYLIEDSPIPLNTELYHMMKSKQLSLF